MGWALFLHTAASDPSKYRELVKAVIVAGAAALIVLSWINATTDFQPLGAGIHPRIFWMETAGLFVYWLWLLLSYWRSARN